MPLAPRGFGSMEDQPLLDASAPGAPWRPSLNASLCSSPRSSQEPDLVDLTFDEQWTCQRCGSPGYEWSDERKLWRCGSCGSTLFSPQPPMATDPAAGMNGRWCFVPSGPWNFEPNEPTFAPGSTPTMSWGIPRGPMPQPGRAHLGPCRVSHGPERVHPHVAHGLDSSLPHGPPRWQPPEQRGDPPRAPDAGPDGPWDGSQKEGPESEAPTHDPSVIPSDLAAPETSPSGHSSTASRRRRRRKRGGPGSPGGDPPGDDDHGDPPGPRQPDLPLGSPNAARPKGAGPPSDPPSGTPGASSSTSWNSMKGPMAGLKFRGGQPPQPPPWHYDKGDLAAFRKWRKRVEMWSLQVVNYVPKREAGILLFNSLKGELEEELEDAAVEKIYDPEGVSFIVDTIQKAVETRTVHLKRQLLATYEHIYRSPTETMRSFVNRYQRTERSLATINIKVEQMYGSEARGTRLLERSKLSPEHQQQVLIGTGQSLEFDTIKEVLLFQWPEHRPLPPSLAPHDRNGKGGHRQQGHSTFTSKGRNKGKPYAKQTLVTEAPEPIEEEPTLENDDDDPADIPDYQDPDEDDGDNEALPEEDDVWEDPEVQEILSVTAKKLAGMMQARKYGSSSSGPPKRSIADRKRSTHCSACGQQGHWAGDAECSVSSKGKGGATKTSNKGDGKSGKNPKAVHFLNHYGGRDDEEADDSHHTSYAVYVSHLVPSHQVHLLDATKAAGSVIVDTACQRLCAGMGWFEAQKNKLLSWSITPLELPTSEYFEFGKGKPIHATFSMFYPAQFGQHICILAPCILEASIPCLASRTWLQDVGAVIDLPNNTVYFHVFDISIPLVMVNGHLGLNLSHRHHQQACLDFWHLHQHAIKEECSQGHVREFVSYPLQPSALKSIAPPGKSGWNPAPDATRPPSATFLAMEMDVLGEDGHQLGSQGAEIPSTTRAPNCADRLQAQEQGLEGQAGDHLHRRQRLHPPPCEEKRQSPRQLRSMPGLPGQMEVEPSAARMGTLHRGIQFLTVATAFLGNCLGSFLDGSSNIRIPGDHRGAAAPSTFSDYSLDQDFGTDLDKTFGKAFSEDFRSDQARTGKRSFTADDHVGHAPRAPDETWSTTDSATGHIQPGPGGAHGARSGTMGGAGAGSRGSKTSAGLEPSLGPIPGGSSARDQRGRLRLGRVAGNLKRSSEILAAEHKIYDSLPTAKQVSHIDVMGALRWLCRHHLPGS